MLVEMTHQISQRHGRAHRDPKSGVKAGGQQRRAHSLAAHIRHDQQSAPVGSGDDINIIAADPSAGFEADGQLQPADGQVLWQQIQLNLEAIVEMDITSGESEISAIIVPCIGTLLARIGSSFCASARSMVREM